MLTTGDYERISITYREKQNERSKKLKKIWGILLTITVFLILLFLFLFPKQFSSGETAWILPVYGGMALITTGVGFLVSLSYTSEKPFFEYVYPELIQQLNMNEGLFLDYHAYEKGTREFNTRGGLFTRVASVRIRRHLKGVTEDQYPFDVYDCTMTTSNGKNQQTHFDGTYYIIHKQLNTGLQIRSNGSPKLKGVKFDRRDEFESIRVYKEKDKDLTNLDISYIEYIKKQIQNPLYKRMYLSIVYDEIHMAVWYKKHPTRKHKKLTLDVLNNVYNSFYEEYKTVNDVANIDQY